MTKTIPVDMSPDDFEDLEATLDLAGQTLSEWKQDLDENCGGELSEDFIGARGRYERACEKFDLIPWEL